MEIKTAQSFLDYYEKIRERTNRIIEVIPPEHIDFTYKPGKFTIVDQIRHIATIERYMYGETISGKQSAYPEFGKELAFRMRKIFRIRKEGKALYLILKFSRLTRNFWMEQMFILKKFQNSESNKK